MIQVKIILVSVDRGHLSVAHVKTFPLHATRHEHKENIVFVFAYFLNFFLGEKHHESSCRCKDECIQY